MNISVTKEQFAKACECKTPEELIAFVKQELNTDLSREEAEKFLAQVADQKLSLDEVDNVAGGVCGAAVSVACLGPGIA